MARLARIVVPGVAHPVTQRGNRRQPVFFGADDYAEYRSLIAQSCRAACVQHLPMRIGAIRGASIFARVGAAICGRAVLRRCPWTRRICWRARAMSSSIRCARALWPEPKNGPGRVRRPISPAATTVWCARRRCAKLWPTGGGCWTKGSTTPTATRSGTVPARGDRWVRQLLSPTSRRAPGERSHAKNRDRSRAPLWRDTYSVPVTNGEIRIVSP